MSYGFVQSRPPRRTRGNGVGGGGPCANRMRHELVADRIDVALGPEGLFRQCSLCPLVNQISRFAIEWHSIGG